MPTIFGGKWLFMWRMWRFYRPRGLDTASLAGKRRKIRFGAGDCPGMGTNPICSNYSESDMRRPWKRLPSLVRTVAAGQCCW